MVNTYQASDGQSIFNAGIAKLMRIDKLKCMIHESRLTSNYFLWYECLLGIYEEIYEMLDEKERNECKIKMMKCVKANPIPNRKDKNGLMYDKANLLEFGMQLSVLEHKYGLGMPKQKATSFLDT